MGNTDAIISIPSLLATLKIVPLSHQKSIGTTVGGKSCHQRLAKSTQDKAREHMVNLSEYDPSMTKFGYELSHLAGSLLCQQNHQDQKTLIFNRWLALVQTFMQETQLPILARSSKIQEPRIIKSCTLLKQDLQHEFVKYCAARLNIRLNKLTGNFLAAIIDTGARVSVIDLDVLKKIAPEMDIKQLGTPTMTKGVGLGSAYTLTACALLDIYVPGFMNANPSRPVMAKISRWVLVMDNRGTDMVIGVDIMDPEKMVPDISTKILRIRSCQGIIAPLTITWENILAITFVGVTKCLELPLYAGRILEASMAAIGGWMQRSFKGRCLGLGKNALEHFVEGRLGNRERRKLPIE
ncbi:MAG: hypothetical protein M1834_004412 [Cirrosporium novae-zelandiae]|nr:MAG: hypothetical protein M1834_004412 [Cirrosporium novae-zelandiae]